MKLRHRWRRRTTAVGLVCSLAVHGVVIALLFLLPWPVREPAPRVETLVVYLVPGGEVAAEVLPSAPPASSGPAVRTDMARQPDQAAAMIAALLRMAQAAHGAPGSSGAGGNVPSGAGSSALKDFIRAQVERRWQIEAGAPDMVVTLRLVIAADGSVLAAAVMEDPGRDLAKQSVTMAARNAALLSSPLQFPPGLDGAGELTVELNTRETRR